MKKYVRERFRSMDNALKLQAKEYERRLEDLNGEAGRIKEVLKESVPREVFDRVVQSMTEKYDRRLDILNDWKTKQEGRSQLLTYVPWLFTIIALVFTYLSYKQK